MATVMKTTFPPRWQRQIRAVTAAAGILTMLVIAACTGPEQGAINETPTSNPSESEASEPAFIVEIPEDVCPADDVIPEEFAAPEEIGYETEFGAYKNGIHPYHKCEYSFGGDLAILDGTQAVQNAIFEFYVIEDSSFNVFDQSEFSQVDDAKVGTAEYFTDWDHAGHYSKNNLNADRGYGLKESECISFQFLASLDNLYVYSTLFFVMPYEGYDPEFDLAVDTAAYQIIESIVAPVVAELERQ
jgi:hypothetical protein